MHNTYKALFVGGPWSGAIKDFSGHEMPRGVSLPTPREGVILAPFTSIATMPPDMVSHVRELRYLRDRVEMRNGPGRVESIHVDGEPIGALVSGVKILFVPGANIRLDYMRWEHMPTSQARVLALGLLFAWTQINYDNTQTEKESRHGSGSPAGSIGNPDRRAPVRGGEAR